MALYKRGGVWWFEFVFNAERVRESTKQGNRRVAEQIESVRRTQMAKGEVGIQDRKPVPTLKKFAPRFERAIEMQCAEKPRTVEFYKSKLAALLASEELASRRIDRIDEAAIEEYVQRRGKFESRRGTPLSPGSINRELATLRRLLRLAHEWKEIQRVPRIRLLRGEHARESILNPAQETVYLAACPAPLADVALLLLDTGLRLGEALSLEWAQVKLEPAQGAKFGYVTVLSGKAKSKKSRNVPLSERVVKMFGQHGPAAKGHVFHRADGSPWPNSHLGQQHSRVRTLLEMPPDFVLHSLRHSFGTRLGESGADAFTIMRLMGHSTVTVSQRYVHPSPEAVELAYERMTAMNLRRLPTNSPTVTGGDVAVAS
jgi:integrase